MKCRIAHGRPVIKGTRVPVEIILGAPAGGMEMREIASEYGICGQGRVATSRTVIGTPYRSLLRSQRFLD